MIRFACPGCDATYTVDDARGGKTGKCPKCQSRFTIPFPEGGPPPPPRSRSAPPVEESVSIEIAPCPGCKAKLSVSASDLGLDVECPECQTVYTAKRPGGSSAGRRALVEEDEDERPSRRGRRDDDEERPARSRRPVVVDDDEDRLTRKRRDDYEDEEEARPRRRRRDENDFEEKRPRRKKRRREREVAEPSGEVTRVATSSYILGGLCLLCSCVGFLGGGFVASLLEEQQQQQEEGQANGEEVFDPEIIGTVLLLVGAIYLLYAIALIVGGVGLTARKNFGRYITFGTASVAAVLALFAIFGVFSNLIGGNIRGAFGSFIGVMLWGGFAVDAFLTMLRHGDEFS